MTDIDEQGRATALEERLDRVLAGESAAGDDPLLALGQQLAQLPIAPRPEAVARFENRLIEWFGVNPPRSRHRPSVHHLLIIAAAVIIGTLAALGRTPPLPAVVDTPTLTATVLRPTSTLTATLQSTVNYERIVVTGPITAIEGETISIAGLSIRIKGGVKGLCIGDAVDIIVTRTSLGLESSLALVKVNQPACQRTALPGSGASKGQKSSGDDDD